MSQDMKHLRGPGTAALLIAVSCLAIACVSAPPTARRSSSLPATGPPAASGGAATASPESAGSRPASSAAATGGGATSGTRSPVAKSPEPASAGGESTTETGSAAPPLPAATPKPEASELPAAQISREIDALGAAGNWPLSSNARVLYLKRRPSATSDLDVFAVFAEVAKPSDAQVATLSDFSRLFKQDVSPVSFSLVEFRVTHRRLERVRSFPLGKHLVFESFKIIPIKKSSDQPFAVSVTFQTQEGSDDVWETFSALGSSQITLQQTLSRSPIVEDIDNDGYLDIIVRERGIEEGTGYETFLTWYKWNGKSFVEYKTTNIVRNLRDFLERAATLLSGDRVGEFLHSSLRSAELSTLESEGKGQRAIFGEIFRLLPSSPDNPNDPIVQLGSIDRVIFPNIFENPFTEQSRSGYRFPLTVRFVTNDGASHFYSAEIYMNRNPFISPQFTFAVGPSSDSR